MLERDIAKSLHENHSNSCFNGKYFFREIEGVKISFPYQSNVEGASWNTIIAPEIWEEYSVCSGIMNPENIPNSWIEFVREVDSARKARGADFPVNLIDGVAFLSVEHPKYRMLKLPKLVSKGISRFKDEDVIKRAINGVLEDDELRVAFKEILKTLVPNVGFSELSQVQVVKILQNQGITNGIVLDLGCGVGRRTQEWAKKTGMTTVGIDRDYRIKWFKPVWTKNNISNLHFVRHDFTKPLPFKNGSVDVVIMEDVTTYVLEDQLVQTLQNIKDVLKEETGILFVGPQEVDGYIRDWRVFKKERNPMNEYVLIEHKASEMLSDKDGYF